MAFYRIHHHYLIAIFFSYIVNYVDVFGLRKLFNYEAWRHYIWISLAFLFQNFLWSSNRFKGIVYMQKSVLLPNCEKKVGINDQILGARLIFLWLLIPPMFPLGLELEIPLESGTIRQNNSWFSYIWGFVLIKLKNSFCDSPKCQNCSCWSLVVVFLRKLTPKNTNVCWKFCPSLFLLPNIFFR